LKRYLQKSKKGRIFVPEVIFLSRRNQIDKLKKVVKVAVLLPIQRNRLIIIAVTYYLTCCIATAINIHPIDVARRLYRKDVARRFRHKDVAHHFYRKDVAPRLYKIK
jgi:hypothetical protein